MALQLAGTPAQVVLLEGGGLDHDREGIRVCPEPGFTRAGTGEIMPKENTAPDFDSPIYRTSRIAWQK